LRKGQDWPKKKSLIGKGKDGTDIVFFSKLVVLLGLVCYVGLTFSMFVPSIAGCRCDHCYRLPGLFCCKLLLLLLLQAASGSETVAKCVYISRENVLQQASKYLSLEMQEIRTCAIGKDQIIASVCINAPPFDHINLSEVAKCEAKLADCQ